MTGCISCLNTYIHTVLTHPHTPTHTHTGLTHAHTHIRTRTQTHAHTHTRTHTHTCACLHTHTQTHTLHTHMHVYSYAHTHTHTHTHAHTRSQTADMEHLQDFERDVKALLQEALWYLNMKKISPDNEEAMRNCVHGVEAQMRRLISTNLSTAVSTTPPLHLASFPIFGWGLGTRLLSTAVSSVQPLHCQAM